MEPMSIEMELGKTSEPVRFGLHGHDREVVIYVNGCATRMPLVSAIAQASRVLDALRLLAAEAAPVPTDGAKETWVAIVAAGEHSPRCSIDYRGCAPECRFEEGQAP